MNKKDEAYNKEVFQYWQKASKGQMVDKSEVLAIVEAKIKEACAENPYIVDTIWTSVLKEVYMKIARGV